MSSGSGDLYRSKEVRRGKGEISCPLVVVVGVVRELVRRKEIRIKRVSSREY